MENTSIKFDQRLDIEFLQSIYENDIEHATTVFNQFLQAAPAMMKEIDEEFHSGVIENFRQKIHKLKPVFSFVGLTPLAKSAEILEKKCKEVLQIYDLSLLYKEFRAQFSQKYPIIQKEAKRLKEQLN